MAKGQCWSLEGAKECLSYCKNHLMTSGQPSHLTGPEGKRNLNSEEAAEIMQGIMVEETIETAEDRAAYRQQLDQQASHKRHNQQDQSAAPKRARTAPKGQSKGKGKGQDFDDATLHRIADMVATRQASDRASSSAGEDSIAYGNQTIGNQTTIVPAVNARQLVNEAMNSGGPQAGILNNRQMQQQVMIPMSQLVLVRDCLNRILGMVNKKQLWHVQEIRQAQAEQVVLQEALAQMDDIRMQVRQL